MTTPVPEEAYEAGRAAAAEVYYRRTGCSPAAFDHYAYVYAIAAIGAVWPLAFEAGRASIHADMAPAEKLVRDRIPQIIADSGGISTTRIAGEGEIRAFLRAKLDEEVWEFLSSDDVAELADVLEVVLTLARERGVTGRELERMRLAKSAERGGFDGRIVWTVPRTDPGPDETGDIRTRAEALARQRVEAKVRAEVAAEIRAAASHWTRPSIAEWAARIAEGKTQNITEEESDAH